MMANTDEAVEKFLNWLQDGLKRRCNLEARRLGLSAGEAEDAYAELRARYWERFYEGKLQGPLPVIGTEGGPGWLPEFIRLCSNMRRQKTRFLLSDGDMNVPSNSDGDQPTAEELGSGEQRERANRTQELIQLAVQRFAPPIQKQCYEKFLEHGRIAPRLAEKRAGQSIPAFRENVRNAQGVALAGALLLAAEEPSHADLLFAPELTARNMSSVGFLSPLVMGRLDVLRQECLSNPEVLNRYTLGFERLWHEALRRLTRLTANIDTASSDEMAVIPTCIHVMFAVARILGPSAADMWQTSWAEAGRNGLLQNPYIRREFAVIGAYAGEDSALAEYSSQESRNPRELAQILLFVDGGTGSKLSFEEIVKGGHAHAINEAREHSETFGNNLADYIGRCLKSERYNNDGLVLMVMQWILRAFEESFSIPSKKASALLTTLVQERARLRLGSTRSRIYDRVLSVVLAQSNNYT